MRIIPHKNELQWYKTGIAEKIREIRFFNYCEETRGRISNRAFHDLLLPLILQ